MDDEILVHRIATGVIVEANGLDPATSVEILNRLDAVEGLADTINPYPMVANRYLSTKSHGFGGAAASAPITPLQRLWAPIFIPAPFETFAMTVNVSVPQVGAEIRLALYDRTGARKRSFSTASAETAGWKGLVIATGELVPRGLNYLMVQCNGVAGVELLHLSGGYSMYHSTNAMEEYGSLRGSGDFAVLPDTIEGNTVGGSALVPYLGIRVG